MKNFVKFAIVGLGGYLIGFYEMKYKFLKCIAEGYVNEKTNEEEKEEEAQE